MQMQEIKTKMKHASLAELNAERNPRGEKSLPGRWGQRRSIRSSIDWLVFCKSRLGFFFFFFKNCDHICNIKYAILTIFKGTIQ